MRNEAEHNYVTRFFEYWRRMTTLLRGWSYMSLQVVPTTEHSL